QPAYRTVRIGEVAEVARAGRAGPHAGGHAVLLRQRLVADPVHAERAFLHHARLAVEFARAIGAGPGAESAADAGVLVDQDDPVLRPLVTGAGGADRHAGSVVAMQTGAGEVHDLGRPAGGNNLIAVNPVEERSGRL